MVREDLAKNFLDAADEIAGAATREAAAEAQKLRAAMKAKLGHIVDDYERELEPLVLAIARLPEKDGGTFDIKNAGYRSSTVSMNVQVLYTKGGRENKFEIDAFTTVAGEDTFSLRLQPHPAQIRENDRATFSDVRRGLALWFATVAPERLSDLKEIMMPDTSVTTGRDMKASPVLRLKTPQA